MRLAARSDSGTIQGVPGVVSGSAARNQSQLFLRLAASHSSWHTKSVERKQVGGGKAGVGERIRLVRGEAEAR